ncbi:MAG: type II toxin-antitoxin system VapC family toxin [Chloroflexi bacterium]|nr:type II toxin-antitoxin system VapC family toxin [Chloroflexota bacterium]
MSQARAVSVLRSFELVAAEQAVHDWSVQQLLKYQLSHRVGMADALIAAVSHRLQLPRYTPNLKHYTVMVGALAPRLC